MLVAVFSSCSDVAMVCHIVSSSEYRCGTWICRVFGIWLVGIIVMMIQLLWDTHIE